MTLAQMNRDSQLRVTPNCYGFDSRSAHLVKTMGPRYG